MLVPIWVPFMCQAEMSDFIIVCKQIADVACWYYLELVEKNEMSTNKTINVRKELVKPFNCVQIND